MSEIVWEGGETSRPENGHELRAMLGLQFFAEGEGADGGANTDGAESDGFLGGMLDGMEDMSADGGDQTEGADGSGEETGADGGDQTEGAGTQGDDNNQNSTAQQAQDQPAEQAQTPPDIAELRYMDQRINLPASAVRAISQAIGQDAMTLLQKGLRFDTQGARERGILSDYAAAAGMDLATYMTQLEQNARETKLQAEMNRLQKDYPNTEPAALRQLAENNLRQQRVNQQAEALIRQQVQRAQTQNAQQSARQQTVLSDVNAFKAAHPEIRGSADVPQEVWDIVNNEHIGLNAAWEKHQAAQLRAENERLTQELNAQKKMNSNRRQSTGSQQSGGDSDSPFLAGLFA